MNSIKIFTLLFLVAHTQYIQPYPEDEEEVSYKFWTGTTSDCSFTSSDLNEGSHPLEVCECVPDTDGCQKVSYDKTRTRIIIEYHSEDPGDCSDEPDLDKTKMF